MLRSDSKWWEIGDGGGVYYLHDILVGLRANCGIAIWDRRYLGLTKEHQAMLLYVFDLYDFKRIGATINSANAASLALAERIGFKREGVLRSWAFDGDTAHDFVSLSLLRGDIA